MAGVKSGFRVAAVMALAAGGWFACSSNERPELPEEVVATTQQALDPTWTPGNLNPVAWYVASPDHVSLNPDGVSVDRWPDIQNGHDAQSFDNGKPQFSQDGWAPREGSLHFAGGQMLHIDNWSDTPAGTNTPLTVMAVIKTTAAADGVVQEVVGWWDPNGGGRAWAGIKGADGRTVADMGRLFGASEAQTYSSPHDLGTSPHVIAWQYLPDSQKMKVTVDGTASPLSSSMPPLGSLPQMPFLIGAGNLLPTELFQGDIAELVIVDTPIGDTDIETFTEYARNKWDGLPVQGSTNPCLDASGNAITTTLPTKIRCDDGNASTYGDFCSNGTCAGTVPPAGSPAVLSPTVWYHAGWAEVSRREVGGIETWFDRTSHHLDLSNGFYITRPTLSSSDWNHDRPLNFAGHNLMFREAWTGAPDGTDAEFSILAVLEPSGSQTTGVAAWWSLVGAGRVAGDLKVNGSATVLDFFRTDPSNGTQDFSGLTDVSTGKHVFAWRYSPGQMRLTVDGITAPPDTGLTTLGALNPEMLLVGADSGFSTVFLNANVAEVAVIPRAINDAELANYDSYAQAEWGGLALCNPSCAGKACGADNGCGGTCACDTPCTSSNDCSIGFTCLANRCEATPGDPGDICDSDAGCAIGVHCSSGSCGGSGAVCGVCAPELACVSGTCQCTCDGKAPGADNGCGVECQGDVGADGCSQDSDCLSGLACVQERCVQPDCDNDPTLFGCGFQGAACGDHCTKNPTCTTNADCPQGFVCGNGNGWRFGYPGVNVCEDAGCPALGCGTITSPCGLCDCTPQCDGKTCGDTDLSDGCHGRCKAVCEDGQSGCQQDTDCPPGDVCMAGTCRPSKCSHPDISPTDCGQGSICGLCPTAAVIPCKNRECGADPITGASCGSCGGLAYCSNAGHCAQLDHTPGASVLDPDGATRTITPQPAPPAASIGTIAGAFAVSERGSATYTIPIEVPPGRGVEPSVAISYSSSTGNGPLGMGWSIDGFSMISRCIRTYAQDTLAAPITGTDADALCLDGQRLVQTGDLQYHTAIDTFALIQGVDSDPSTAMPESFLVYAKDGRILEFGATDDSRLMLDSSTVRSWAIDRVSDRAGNFMTINYRNELAVDSDTGQSSTAELLPDTIEYSGHDTTNGDRELTFVYDDGTRTDHVRGSRPGGGRLTLSHLVKSIEVRAQNALVRRYTPTYGTTAGLTTMTSIQECAGPTQAACKPVTSFEYSDDGGGFQDPIDLGDMPANIPVNGPVPADIVPYGIVNKDANGFDSLTVAVVQSSSQLTTPIPAGVDVGVSFVPVAGPIAAIGIDVINWLGSKTDTSYLYRDYTFNPAPGYPLATENWPCEGQFSPKRHIMVDSGDTAESLYDQCPSKQVAADPSRGGTLTTYLAMRPEWFVDIDGDGIQDKIFCVDTPIAVDTSNQLDFVISGVTHTNPFKASEADATGSIEPFGSMCNFRSAPFSTAFDVNGDGTTEIVAYDPSLGWAALTYESDRQLHWHPEWFEGVDIEANSKYGVYVLDANGDGLKDLLALPAHVGGALADFPVLAINTGRGFREQLVNAQPGIGHQPTLPVYVVDLDHDGQDELLVSTSTAKVAWQVWKFSNGNLVGEDVPSLVAGPGVVGDFNGDGNLDVFSRSLSQSVAGQVLPTAADALGSTGITLATDLLKKRDHFLLHYGKGVQNRLLHAVTDGLGKRIEVTYGTRQTVDPIGGSTIGTMDIVEGDSCGWPTRCLTRVDQPVVSYYIASHYLDQARLTYTRDARVIYEYANPRGDSAGYGWLGFERRTITEQDGDFNTMKTTTTNYQPPPQWTDGVSTVPYTHVTTGMPISTTVTYPHVDSGLTVENDHLIVSTQNTWQIENSSANLPFAFLTARSTITTDVGVGHASIPLFERDETFTPDEYGNTTAATDTSWDYPGAPLVGSQTVNQVTRIYDHSQANLDSWLVGLVQDDYVSSTPRCNLESGCDVLTQTRHFTYEYYPGTDLVHVVTREKDSGDVTLERRTTMDRDDFGNVTDMRSEDLQNNVREHATVYDDRNLFPINEIDIGEGEQLTWQVRYDDRFGRLTVSADPNGIDETYSYDDFGFERIHTGPSGRDQTDYFPDDQSQTSLGITIPAAYSVREERTGGDVTTVEYDAFGAPLRTSTTGFGNDVVYEEMTYDLRHRVAQHWRPHLDGDSTQSYVSYQYDDLNRLTLETYPNGLNIEHDFAALPALDQETMSSFFLDSGFIGSGWDPSGAIGPIFVERTFDQWNGHTTGRVLDRDGETTGTRDANGFWAQYVFGAFGHLDSISAAENVVTFTHDAYDRLGQTSDDVRGIETATYDAFDELVEKDNAAHNRVFSPDDFGRAKRIDEDDGSEFTFTYDGTGPNERGRLVETTSSTGERTTYGYEAGISGFNRGLLNRVTRHLTGFQAGDTERTLETHYEFDNDSRLERVDYPATSGDDRLSVAYGFDAHGHVTSAYNFDNPSESYWQFVDADEGYRVKHERLGAASCDGSTGVLSEHGYDAVTGLETSIQTSCGAQPIQQLSYGYDHEGKMTYRGDTLAGTGETFDYDDADRLHIVNDVDMFDYYDNPPANIQYQAGVGSYGYDLIGLNTAGPYTFGHDSVGNINARSGPGVPGESENIVYTSFDLPRSVTDGNAVQTEFGYDAGNERVVKQNSAGKTTYYAGDLYQRAEDNGTTLHRHMIFVGNRAVAQVTQDDSGTRNVRSLHQDVLGSTQAVANADGSIDSTFSYSPFGQVTIETGSGSDVIHQFTGQETDDDLKLTNMRGRMYDPIIGQFLTADPVMADAHGALSRFAYVDSSPLNYTDPSGFNRCALGVSCQTYAVAVPTAIIVTPPVIAAAAIYNPLQWGAVTSDVAGGGADVAASAGGLGDTVSNVASTGAFNMGAGGIDLIWHGINQNLPVTKSSGMVTSRGSATAGGGAANPTHTAPVDFAHTVPDRAGPPVQEGPNLLNLPPSGDPIGVFAPPPPEPPSPPLATRAWAEGSNTVLEYPGGAHEVRGGPGSSAWKNNNPGNLRRSPYQIGTAHGFAVFPNEAEGEGALRSLLSSEKYASKTIDQAISSYAPSFENNTGAYQASVRNGIGVPGSTRIDQLTNRQFDSLVSTIRKVEGWQPGTVVWR